MALLLLVRHGHSVANANAVLAGWTEGVGLTERGREEVARLAARMVDAEVRVARLVTSPLQRCRETSQILLPDATPEIVDDLGECHYGAWTGRPLAELTSEPLWRTVQDDPESARFPDSEEYAGESLAQMSSRVVAALGRIDAEVEAEQGPDAVWVAVSHGDPIKAALTDALGAGLRGLQRVHVDPASVSVVRRTGERQMVLAVNSAGDAIRRHQKPSAVVPPGDATVGGGTG
ncbi:MSMEG_4193 family putative phosphomutase [Knoellia subterranea]|uniref:Phosphoglycerate mutase n=1 Tax=Knoellia subterranea KCTC 19937 TaxID=1385521 RepID=A0A0A0JRM4_9MICO|nr:MSMEG_4193 family putative phosphomutase [Knoellia subterranea]KGN38707.1 phosphoglycerate mutase [Knoellia subterranea KCTC 19937]